MKKIIILGICMLLITLVLPTSIADIELPSTNEEDFELHINAGIHKRNIGLGIAIDVLSYKTENATVFFNISLDYIVRNNLDGTYSLNFNVYPESQFTVYINPIVRRPDGIKFITITAEIEDTIVTRSGLSINRLVILF